MNEHLLSDRRSEVDTGPRKGTRHHWEDWKHTRECRTVVGKRELRYAQVSPVSKLGKLETLAHTSGDPM